MREPQGYLDAVNRQRLDPNWSPEARLLVWLAHINNTSPVKLADTEIERLASFLAGAGVVTQPTKPGGAGERERAKREKMAKRKGGESGQG